eukprot:4481277-Ditylum_brightwellii.AAC.1
MPHNTTPPSTVSCGATMKYLSSSHMPTAQHHLFSLFLRSSTATAPSASLEATHYRRQCVGTMSPSQAA